MAATDTSTVFGQCRCCLNSGNHKRFSEPCLRKGTLRHYRDTFLECFNLFLSTSIKLPDLICSSCVHLLDTALEFRTMVIQSEQKLLKETNNTEREMGLHSEVEIKEEDDEPDGAQYSMDYEDSNDSTEAPLGTEEKEMADTELSFEVPIKSEFPDNEASMECKKDEKKKKRPKKQLKKDSLSYQRLIEQAKSRKRKFLDNMTAEQKEIKRVKDREYYRKKKAENKVTINSDMTEHEKWKIRKKWRKASKKYRDNKKIFANQLQE